MSLKSKAIWAPAPSTERGRPTQLSTDSKGERLAYANGKSIFLRSIDRPSESVQYTGHTATTTVARFAPSGFYVASGDASGMVRVWDSHGPQAGTSAANTKGEYHIARSVADLAWDGDSQRIIAVGDGKERFGHCITADSGNSVGEISGHSAPINAVAIRQQRPLRAVTGSDDASLVFYHGAPFKFNTSLRGQHNRFVYGVAFSPDGSSIVSVGADKKIWLYDGKTGEVRSQLGSDEHKGSIFSVSWAPDSKRFVTSSADQTVKIWDVEAGKATQSWRIGPDTVSIPDHQVGVVWPNRSDKLILSLSLSGAINYLTEGEDKPRQTLHGHQKNITAFTRVESPATLWSGSADGKILFWQADSAESASAKPVDGETHKNYVSSLTETGDGGVLSVGWDDTLRHIDAKAGTFTGSTASTDGQPRGVAVADKKWVVGTHKGLEVYDASGSRSSFLSTTFSTTCIAASGSRVAIGADDSTIRTYSLKGDTLTLEKEIPDAVSQPSTLSFSHDGKSLAVGSANGKITVYDTASWQASNTRWSAHTGRVTSIAWRRDDQFAASASLDTHVFAWSVAKPGRRISADNAHKEGVNGVRWLDEKTIVSAGADGALKTWSLEGV